MPQGSSKTDISMYQREIASHSNEGNCCEGGQVATKPRDGIFLCLLYCVCNSLSLKESTCIYIYMHMGVVLTFLGNC